MIGADTGNVVALRPDTERRTVGGSRTANDETRGRKHLTRDEVQQAMKVARQGTRNGERDALMIRLAFEHGLRASELVGLKWQSINFSEQTISVQRAKGSVSGTHPLQGETLRALRRYHRSLDKPIVGTLFSSERGAPLSVDGFRRLFGRITLKALGVQWNPHALRHACGVHLINSGTDIRTVQSYMGHSNIQNTVLYTALSGRQFEHLAF